MGSPQRKIVNSDWFGGQPSRFIKSVVSKLFVLLDVLKPPLKTASRPDHPPETVADLRTHKESQTHHLPAKESKTTVFFLLLPYQTSCGYPEKAANFLYKIMKVSKKSDANKSFYIFV